MVVEVVAVVVVEGEMNAYWKRTDPQREYQQAGFFGHIYCCSNTRPVFSFLFLPVIEVCSP